MATELQTQEQAQEQEQETEPFQTSTEETVKPELSFQALWEDITTLTDELVQRYREAGMPPVKVYSKQKGNVHFRMDIHPGGRQDKACDSWQRPKQPRAKVTEPETAVPEETTSQSE